MQKQLKRAFLIPVIAVLILLALVPAAGAQETENPLKSFRGLVLEVGEAEENPLSESGYDSLAFDVEIKILNGEFRDEIITIYHITGDNLAYDIFVEPGDKVFVEAEVEDGVLLTAYIADHVRDTFVYVLMGLFALLVLAIGRTAGFRALFSLALTIVLVTQVFLPLLLKGYSPLFLAALLSVLSIVVTMLLIGGINRKSWAAIIGTASGVLVAGILAFIFGKLTKLTGLSHEETQMLMYIPQGINFNYQGLLFAGIMIGALGAVMDVGMSVASSMFEMKAISPEIAAWDLFRSGMNVGHDIMGTMANTLILAYLGSSMPLLLLFHAYNVPLERILNLDAICTELVRAFSGSIGLVAAIPLTAAVSAWLALSGKGGKRYFTSPGQVN